MLRTEPPVGESYQIMLEPVTERLAKVLAPPLQIICTDEPVGADGVVVR